jgi:hypothetical protein
MMPTMKDATRRAAFSAALLLALSLSSCRKVPITSIELPEDRAEAAPGLSVRAAFLYDPAEIEHLFKSFLPMHGIVPVLVAVRNDGAEPACLFSRNSFDLREEFGGFSLCVGDSVLEPLHPIDVVSIARNEGRLRSYRKSAKKDIVAGMVLPPAGVYYAWKGFREYREFKPLVAASLLPALYEGLFEPLVLQPGEERSGYLYFNLDGKDSPYESIEEIVEKEEEKETVLKHRLKEGFALNHELVAKPARAAAGPGGSFGALAAADSLPAKEIFFLNDAEPGSGGEAFFAILKGGGSESLVLGRMNGGVIEAPPVYIKKFSGESASIAGAAAGHGRIVCAVNFKRTSKVFLVAGGAAAGAGDDRGAEIRGGIALEREIELPRSVRSVFIAQGGFYALTSDSFCTFFPFDALAAGDYRKLGSDARAVFPLPGGELAVFDGSEVYLAGLTDSDRLSRKGEPAPLPGDPEPLGLLGGRLLLRIPGRKNLGDTLVVFDAGSMEEISRIGLRGRPSLVSIHSEGVLAALEEGTILDIGPGEDGAPCVHRSAWLPFDPIALSGNGNGITAVSAGGTIYFGPLDGAPPLAGEEGAPAARVPVGISGPSWRKFKEKKPRNNR